MPRKKTTGMTVKDDRTRNWTFIVYPDSAPGNWRDVINEEHVQWIESPLHDADENADGEQKKPHWHIAVCYSGKKSYEQVQEITRKIKATIPQKVASMQGLIRYMVHMDNPEKKQYDRSAIVGHGGIDIAVYLKPSSSMRYLLLNEMMEWVSEYGCTEFRQICDYARRERFEDWYPMLCDNSAYIIGEYIKSVRFETMQMQKKGGEQ